MSNVGTPRKLVLDGISFDLMADANITFNRSKFETEGIATTGATLFKMTKRVQTKEGVTVGATGELIEVLDDLASKLSDVTLAIEYADGTTYKSQGKINFENWESETGTATLTLIPKRDWLAFPV